jgi:hypothetical protein
MLARIRPRHRTGGANRKMSNHISKFAHALSALNKDKQVQQAKQVHDLCK